MALVLLTLIWSYNWIVMKQVLRWSGPFTFSALRYAFGTLVLFAVLLARREPLRPPPLLPTALIKGDKTLRRLKAGDWPAMPTREIWLLTHPDQRRLARIEAVIDWLDDTLRARGMAA